MGKLGGTSVHAHMAVEYIRLLRERSVLLEERENLPSHQPQPVASSNDAP